MNEHSSAASVREDRLERLLREFYAAEMPAALRDCTAAGGPSARTVPVSANGHQSPPLSRTLGLTAALAALMLALSALLWSGSRPAETPHGNQFQANDAGGAGSYRVPAGEHLPTPFPDAGPGRQPVELQSGSHSGVPVGTEPDGAAGGDNDFPELDIRIIPIDDR
jgi:hypothetical protein